MRTAVLLLLCLFVGAVVGRRRRMMEDDQVVESPKKSFLDDMPKWKSPKIESNTLEMQQLETRLRALQESNKVIRASNELLKETLQNILFGDQHIGLLIHDDLLAQEELRGEKLNEEGYAVKKTPETYLALFKRLAKEMVQFKNMETPIFDCLDQTVVRRMELEKIMMPPKKESEELVVLDKDQVKFQENINRAKRSVEKLLPELSRFTDTYANAKSFDDISQFLSTLASWRPLTATQRSEAAMEEVKKYLDENKDFIVFPETWKDDFGKMHLERDAAVDEEAIFSRFSDWYMSWRKVYWEYMEGLFSSYRGKIAFWNRKLNVLFENKPKKSVKFIDTLLSYFEKQTEDPQASKKLKLIEEVADEADFNLCCTKLTTLFNKVKLPSEGSIDCNYTRRPLLQLNRL